MAIPHLTLPLRFVNGRAAVSEQGTDLEIQTCIEAILRYPVGYRIDLPAFGISDPTFDPAAPDVEAIHNAVARWEPRAAQATIDGSRDQLDATLARISIDQQRSTTT